MIKKLKNFSSKSEIFSYVLSFSKSQKDLVFIRGSTARGKIKAFSDIDAEIYSTKRYNPYYEVILYRSKPILLSLYYHKYRVGKDQDPPKKIKILQGKFNDQIEKIFLENFYKKINYNKEDFAKIQCQLLIDSLFKFLRNKNEENLQIVQKRIIFNK